MKYETEQEVFWASDFGNAYVARNSNPQSVVNRTGLFAKILARTHGVTRILELGANIGQNLMAIRNLIPHSVFGAIEINEQAVQTLSRIPNTEVFRGSIFDFEPATLGKYDLTLTAGVMIHIDPSYLSEVYSRLYECSTKYILISEYYNPAPVEVVYRGHTKRLFKRDFCGEMLDKYPGLELLDYGFQYHRDYNFPADDANWFLMRKKMPDAVFPEGLDQ